MGTLRWLAGAVRRRLFPEHPGWPVVLGPVRDNGRQVALRPVAPDDAAAWVQALLTDQDAVRPWWPSDPRPWHERITERAWREQCESSLRPARRGQALPFAVTVDGAFAGQLTLDRVDRAQGCAEIGMWLCAAHRGAGVATAAVGMLLHHAFDVLGLQRVVAPIAVGNTAAAAGAARVGFRQEGVMRDYLHVGGRWTDHVLWAVVRSDPIAGREVARQRTPVS
ncbi:GNAT family protein [Kutzneria viridogrisea]|uniref:N-acetyltransferase domain-containing protein n=2 Tax=Kutzneria TaxID=43356 RepID=W5W7W5_9PSEU|nr:GNAT family protein [Kutzneria albida]AHH96820.1 hypothetical protein KALB_3455 [Kutzneria albida DSM 43870]MBA8927959.1 RimJ/RimL family protein N-acetyltransferase [Kutzneria viridogrisea]